MANPYCTSPHTIEHSRPTSLYSQWIWTSRETNLHVQSGASENGINHCTSQRDYLKRHRVSIPV